MEEAGVEEGGDEETLTSSEPDMKSTSSWTLVSQM